MMKVKLSRFEIILYPVLFILVLALMLQLSNIADLFFTLRFFFGVLLFLFPGYLLTKIFYHKEDDLRFLLHAVLSILISGFIGTFFIFYKNRFLVFILYLLLIVVLGLYAFKKKISIIAPIDLAFSRRMIFLIFITFCSLLVLVVSWLLSYPTNSKSINELTIMNFHPLFWIGLASGIISLLFLYRSLKKGKIWISFLLMMVLFSSYFFYSYLPGPDSHYFRSLSEKFQTGKIDTYSQGYFQWPAFFSIVNVLCDLTGMQDMNLISIFIFIIIGFIIFGGLHVYYSRQDNRFSVFSLFSYVLILFYFLNFQFAPQSLALGLIITMFILVEGILEKENLFFRVLIYVSFMLLVMMHAFFAVFFVIYIILLFIFNKIINKISNKHSCDFGYMSIFSFIFYVSYLLIVSVKTINTRIVNNIKQVLPSLSDKINPEYSSIASRLIDPATSTVSGSAASLPLSNVPIFILDKIFQALSRILLFPLFFINVLGFIFLTFKRKIGLSAMAILGSGLIYFVLGLKFDILGIRALQVIMIPISFGIIFWLRRHIRFELLGYILIVLCSISLVAHANYHYSSYHDPSDRIAAEYVVSLLEEHEKSYGKVPVLSVFASKQSADYIAGKTSLRDKYEFLWYDYKKRDNYDFVIWNINSMASLEKNLPISQRAIIDYGSYFKKNYQLIYSDGYSEVYSKY